MLYLLKGLLAIAMGICIYLFVKEQGVPWYAASTRSLVLRTIMLVSALLAVVVAIYLAATSTPTVPSNMTS